MSAHAPDSQPGRSTPRHAWRGKSETPSTTARHRWQKGWTLQPHEAHQRRRSRGGLRIAATLVIFFALLGIFLWNVLDAPQRTPVLVLAARSYQLPLPPNCWIAEDLAALEALDGDTISLQTISFDVPRHQALQELANALSRIANQENHDRLVVYVAMHGATDEQGRPCLLTGSSTPLDSSTWLPIPDLLQAIRKHLDLRQCKALLVLDTHRQPLPLPVAPPYQTFTARVAQLASAMSDAPIAVLSSVDEGQIGYECPHLHRTVFSYFFQLGLAGMADAYGDRDRIVSLTELARYVQEQVIQWSTYNRGVPQKPRLWNPAEDDFVVASTLHPAALKDAADPVRSSAARTGEAGVDATVLHSLWERYERLRESADLVYLAPERVHVWEQQLARCQQLAQSGSAYTADSVHLAEQLDVELASLEQQLAQNEPWPQSILHAWRAATSLPLSFPKPRVHDLANAAYLGLLPASTIESIRQQTEQSMLLSDMRQLQANIERLSQVPGGEQLNELHFIRLLARYRVGEVWNTTTVLEQIQACRKLAQIHGAPLPPVDGKLGDVRAHAWIRAQIANADQQLREVQDLLLAGRDSTGEELVLQCQEIERKYMAAEQKYRDVARAYALRDQLFAKLPALLAWYVDYARPIRSEVETPEPFARTEDAYGRYWLPIVQSTQELAASLQQGPGSEEDQVAEQLHQIQQIVEQLENSSNSTSGSWTSLQQAFEAYCDQFEQCPPSGAVAQQLYCLIRIPTLTAAKREALYARYCEVTAELHTAYFTGSDVAQQTTRSEDLWQEDYVRWWNQLPQSPLELWLAGKGKDSATQTDSLEKQVGQLRQQCQLLQTRIRQSTSNRANADSQVAEADGDSGLHLAARDETLARRTADLLSARTVGEAVSKRRRLELQQLMLWNGERSVRDFWGPAEPMRMPFFPLAAQDYLASAAMFWPVVDYDKRQETIRQLQDEAGRLLVLRPESSALVSGVDRRVDMPVYVERSENLRTENASSGAIVSASVRGWVGCRVHAEGQPVENSTGLRLLHESADGEWSNLFALTAALRNPALVLQGQLSDSSAASYRLVAAFRGHEYDFVLSTGESSGRTIVTHPITDRSARVTVQRARPDVGAVLFVVDSSSSMGQSVPDTGSLPNVRVAAQAVLELATGLLGRGDLQAGVLVYGHRVGFGRITGKVRVQPAYEGRIDDDLRPQRDIESVVNWGPVRREDLTVWDKRMSSLIGWGQSPHFGALTTAYEQLVGSATGMSKSIVWLTDGSQFRRADAAHTDQDDVTWDQLLEIVDREKIPVHVVLVGQQSSEDVAAIQELVTRSGGSLRTNADVASLITTLASSAEQTSFSLMDNQQKPVGTAEDGESHAALLGNTIVVPQEQLRVSSMNVCLTDLMFPLQLDGGERVLLEYDETRQRLSVPAFRRQLAQAIPLWDGVTGQTASVTAFVHRPLPMAQDVNFTISLQTSDGQFVSWPKKAWIEITPVGRSGEALPSYIYYDIPFEQEAPVPAYTCIARSWPEYADRAEVQFWFATSTLTPLTDVALSDCVEDEVDAGDVAVGDELDRSTPSGTTGELLRADINGPGTSRLTIVSHVSESTYCVEVTERQNAGRPLSVPLGVDLALPANVVPSRIERSYQPELGSVTHSFMFSPEQRDPVEKEGRLRTFSRDSFSSRGLSLATQPPVVIEVPEIDNYLSTTR